MTSSLNDLIGMDWGRTEFPDGFQPMDAIVLVKGVYETDDGDLTRPVWVHRWTMPLARNPAERLGALRLAEEMVLAEAMTDYDGVEND